jgi:hypothetical protein
MTRFENPENGRFYYMLVQKDMFDDLVLVVIRGGLGRSLTRCVATGSPQFVDHEIDRLSKRRLQRGYILVD